MLLDNLDLIKATADRMRNPLHVSQIALRDGNQNSLNMVLWDNLSLAGGASGLVLLFASLDMLYPNEKWDAAALAYIMEIKKSLESGYSNSLSLYGGLCGAGFAVEMASRNGTRYQKFIDVIDQFILGAVQQQYLDSIQICFTEKRPVPPRHYDLISGIVGIGLYALKKISKPPFFQLLDKIVATTVQLCKPIEIEGKKVPGWFIARDDQFNEHDKSYYDKGSFNVGLAHGIPGVMGLLAVCKLNGYDQPGLMETLQLLSEWVASKCCLSKFGACWPAALHFDEETGNQNKHLDFCRDAWCYGAPGVARALWLASQALKNPDYGQLALDSLQAAVKRPREEWSLPGPTLCHGIGGYLMIVDQMANDTQDSICLDAVSNLKKILLSYFDENNAFGFQDYDPIKNNRGKYKMLDRPGLLEGTAGVLLSLFSVETRFTKWQWPFLNISSP
jgi:hypothetical protein